MNHYRFTDAGGEGTAGKEQTPQGGPRWPPGSEAYARDPVPWHAQASSGTASSPLLRLSVLSITFSHQRGSGFVLRLGSPQSSLSFWRMEEAPRADTIPVKVVRTTVLSAPDTGLSVPGPI